MGERGDGDPLHPVSNTHSGNWRAVLLCSSSYYRNRIGLYTLLAKDLIIAKLLSTSLKCFAMSSILPLLNNWKTTKEQGLLFGLAFAGASFSRAVTYPIAGFACEYLGGWESIFYLTGTID